MGAASEAEGETAAEEEAFPAADDHSRDEAGLLLAEQAREGTEAHLRPGKGVGHEVEAHSAQVPPGGAQRNRRRHATEPRRENREDARGSPGRRHPPFDARGGQGVAEAGSAAQDDPLEAAGGRREVAAEEPLDGPEREQVRPRPDDASAQRTEDDESGGAEG